MIKILNFSITFILHTIFLKVTDHEPMSSLKFSSWDELGIANHANNFDKINLVVETALRTMEFVIHLWFFTAKFVAEAAENISLDEVNDS